MKGEMETTDTLLTEFPNFPSESRSKLATYLKSGTIETSDVNRQDLELFRLAGKRLRISALNNVCETMENELSKQLSTRFLREGVPLTPYRRTHSECHAEPEVNHNVNRRLRGSESVPYDDFPPKQIYFLMVGRNAEGKEAALVYNVLTKRMYEKDIHLKGNKDIQGVCGVHLNDAPYLFLLVSSGGSVRLLRNDVIKDKWKTCSKYKKSINMPKMVNFGNSIYVFAADCPDVIKYSITDDKWSECARLCRRLTSPVLTKHGGKLYIFEEQALQVFEPFSETVTLIDCPLYTSTGFAVSLFNEIYILSENSITSYDVTTRRSVRDDYPSLGYRPLHAVFTGFGRVFALTTDSHGKFELKSTRDLVTWEAERAFSKSVQLELTGLVNYIQHCPIGPFETYEESLRKAAFSKK